MQSPFIHPYIPNSVPEVMEEMMREIGIRDIEELFKDLPLTSGPLNIPGPMSEYELRRHIEAILSRNNEKSLVAALMKADGIAPEGAAAIRIRRAGKPSRAEPVLLPVRGLGVPFADVAVEDGDAVEVLGLEATHVTVVGLVNKPGTFPYPPGGRMNLAQALAAAGGLDADTNPRYVKICRQDASGRLIAVAFKITRGSLGEAVNVKHDEFVKSVSEGFVRSPRSRLANPEEGVLILRRSDQG